jgi:hypothetical protein
MEVAHVWANIDGFFLHHSIALAFESRIAFEQSTVTSPGLPLCIALSVAGDRCKGSAPDEAMAPFYLSGTRAKSTAALFDQWTESVVL